jgi:hypothetical protein
MAYTPAPPVALDLWLPWVIPHAPGLPPIAARLNVLAAAIEFCERSRVWKYTPAAFAAELGVGTYAIPCPDQADAVIVEAVRYNGEALIEKTPDQLGELYPDWRNETPDAPVYYTALDQDSFTVVPAPSVDLAGALAIDGAYKPDRDGTTLPAILYRNYLEGIASGALARILAAPNKPWSDPQGAMFHGHEFNTAIAEASGEAITGFSRAPVRVRSAY